MYSAKCMRGEDQKRYDRLENRCRRQEAEKDPRRQRDDPGHVGRARPPPPRHPIAAPPRRRAAAGHRPHGDTNAEHDRQNGSAARQDQDWAMAKSPVRANEGARRAPSILVRPVSGQRYAVHHAAEPMIIVDRIVECAAIVPER